jgi:uncharacterized protein (DUF58 family)
VTRATAIPPAPERTPERPGPGPVPQQVLRSLDLAILHRVESLMPGEHMTPQVGSGTELAGIRAYRPGDDVRHIDWNVTARLQEPHVRVHVAERALTSWLVLDVSASMGFGTADRRKADVAEGAAIAVGHLATRQGNRLGVMTFGAHSAEVIPPLQGRQGLMRLMLALRATPEPDGQGATDLPDALSRAGRLARQRGLVMLVSDFRGPHTWRTPLMRLLSRHHVIAVEVRDPREQELPAVGDLWLVDPETGRQLRVDTNRRKLRERFAKRAAAERDELAHELRRTGADHIVLSTQGDWLRELARHMNRRTVRRRR